MESGGGRARAGLSRTWDAALAPAELLAPQLLSAASPLRSATCVMVSSVLAKGHVDLLGWMDGRTARVTEF